MLVDEDAVKKEEERKKQEGVGWGGGGESTGSQTSQTQALDIEL